EAARSGKFDLLHKIYSAHITTAKSKQELDELSALVKKSGPVCILCYERDHKHCHRQWIAEIIEDRDGVRTENLPGKQMYLFPLAPQPKRPFHHLHATPADMHGGYRAVLL